MRLIQCDVPPLGPCLGVVQGDRVLNLTSRHATLTSVVAAFRAARRAGKRLADQLDNFLATAGDAEVLSYADLHSAGRLLPPISEGPGARVLVTGTGLTHLGSVEQRDSMHKADKPAGPASDSRKMFELGLQGGRPTPGCRGVAPEWFYKGDGRNLRGPGQMLDIPAFAPDGGEEPEIAGVYMVDDQGVPCRIGFVQGNEWSDHVTEKVNYLYLAPSKLRVCAIGPELVTDLDFEDIRGQCRVYRNGQTLYESGELLTGEKNMCHSPANLEDHHFKFPQHRFPGDVHVHFFGTMKLSYGQRDWQYQTGDEVEVSFNGLGAPLRNPVRRLEAEATPMAVEPA